MNVLSPEYICNKIYSGVVLCLIKTTCKGCFVFISMRNTHTGNFDVFACSRDDVIGSNFCRYT